MTDWTFKGFFDKILLYKGVFEMVASENKKAYDKVFQKEQTIGKSVKFFKNTNKDLLDYLETIKEPFGTYVKRLIKEDMKKKKPE